VLRFTCCARWAVAVTAGGVLTICMRLDLRAVLPLCMRARVHARTPAGLLFFTTYTLLVLFWAEIYHQARSMPTASLRPMFVGFNVLVYAAQVCAGAGGALPHQARRARTLAHAHAAAAAMRPSRSAHPHGPAPSAPPLPAPPRATPCRAVCGRTRPRPRRRPPSASATC
jgi:hypothetical protein